MTPSWFIFTRFFVTRHNKFMFKVRHGFFYVLDECRISYTRRGKFLYFEGFNIIEKITSIDMVYMVNNSEAMLKTALDMITLMDVHYVNELDEFEMYLLGVTLKFDFYRLLISHEYKVIYSQLEQLGNES